MSNVFNEKFLWGAASAAPQIEGAWNEDGRTPSIWDVAPSKRIKNGDDCHTSCDHYHYWKEDVALMKKIGLKSYRFSLSWSRIIPKPGMVNEKGIAFYNQLIDELIANDIEPLITIFHWDLPVWMQEMGGWYTNKIVDYFREYTEVVVKAFSDRVTYWITINEPQCFIMNGHLQGAHAPFHKRALSLARLSENCMRCHGVAVKTIRANAIKKPKVGIAMATSAYVPENDSVEAIEEARRLSFESTIGVMSNKWWFDPILKGEKVKAFGIFRTKMKHIDEINQPLDFLGLNVYAPSNDQEWTKEKHESKPGIPRTQLGWVIDERVLYWAIRFMSERYGLPIMITENGMANLDFEHLDRKIHDPQRVDFIHRYLGELKRAVSEGYEVIGYQHWSIIDNFEWAEGYDPRFGLIYVDYSTQKRILKDSAYEYKKIIESNGEVIEETEL